MQSKHPRCRKDLHFSFRLVNRVKLTMCCHQLYDECILKIGLNAHRK